MVLCVNQSILIGAQDNVETNNLRVYPVCIQVCALHAHGMVARSRFLLPALLLTDVKTITIKTGDGWSGLVACCTYTMELVETRHPYSFTAVLVHGSLTLNEEPLRYGAGYAEVPLALLDDLIHSEKFLCCMQLHHQGLAPPPQKGSRRGPLEYNGRRKPRKQPARLHDLHGYLQAYAVKRPYHVPHLHLVHADEVLVVFQDRRQAFAFRCPSSSSCRCRIDGARRLRPRTTPA